MRATGEQNDSPRLLRNSRTTRLRPLPSGCDHGHIRDVRFVVMGVAGSGKTTVGTLLAERLGMVFKDGDAFHPPENVAKMAAGIPLDDADRAPWLDAIHAWLAAHPDGVV